MVVIIDRYNSKVTITLDLKMSFLMIDYFTQYLKWRDVIISYLKFFWERIFFCVMSSMLNKISDHVRMTSIVQPTSRLFNNNTKLTKFNMGKFFVFLFLIPLVKSSAEIENKAEGRNS
jgi:hypothetical protein